MNGKILEGVQDTLVLSDLESLTSVRAVTLILSETPSSCETMQRHERGLRYVLFSIHNAGGVAEGTYSVVPLEVASAGEAGDEFAMFHSVDPDLNKMTDATGGRVHLDEFRLGDSAVVRGRFEIEFGAEHVEGSFDDATTCLVDE